jgi:phenylacetate-CoA ligase
MRGFVKTLLKKAPIPIAELAEVAFQALPASWKYGRPFEEALALLKQSESWDEKKLVDYQQTRLALLLDHCYKHVPYYREIFRQRGITPKDIQTIEDLRKLPVLTKETVRKRSRDLIAENISVFGIEPTRTSGSSGTALSFFYDKTTKAVDRALALRHLLWMGYRKGDSLAFFKALPLTNPRKICKYLPGARELRVSFHNSSERHLAEIADAFEVIKPAFITAWPSCLYVFARWLERKKRTVPTPKGIRTSSENLHPHIREQIQRVFKVTIMDWYGQEEGVAAAGQCPLVQQYHIQGEMGIVELVSGSQERGDEIVGTCLHNFAMPFIRYRTGDLAVSGDLACGCGRKQPTLSKIVGREADFVVTPEKNVISPLILAYSFYYLDEIKAGQIIQEDLQTLRILVVAWDKISSITKQRLLDELRSRLDSPKMNLIVEEVEDIPQTQGGKRPFVISRVKMEDHP